MNFTHAQRVILEKLIKSSTTPIAIVNRAKIVLHILNNDSTYFIVKHLQVDWKTVQKWGKRWKSLAGELEKIKDLNLLKKQITESLRDAKRSGKPPKYTPEQIVKIISLACTTPLSHEIPISHWSSRALAIQAEKMGIVSKISPSKISSILKPRLRNTDGDFDHRVNEICDIYKTSIELHKKNVHVISVDEKSGIQAIERANPNLSTRCGSIEKIEHEYIRHGTQCLIANFEVGTGKIIAPMICDERKESDFLKNIQNLISTHPKDEWIIILDQLNTHKSPSLVRWIADQIGFKEDLGVPRKRGILNSMKSRMKFLEDSSHRIRFKFTPKHCSWMNQIEIWFSVLSRRCLKRSNVKSLNALRKLIIDYIEFNNVISKPYNWSYKGKVLRS
jgi:transposase